ncbi:drug resistance transporter, EmrB/QacA subfamily [Streptoalloteichus tenebrarius]|uniref:Drug resistance transporter, EmrB/QacA subfamily n=1 Tax=Streptoalloteichus tenebrarius (strain ATCC 17920 / DSM 40477 / JCM 4838 / CBS 697.72 / NBRC 16177 / NCIMB 11028 / NRRL B-12390 / A12253. 1 / ISP 5477) TaxID=1933 RepID=A0ABT1HY33_STRSD|nr:MFS transporter [Streptoalloteichus tenebrarius]MCP2260443.1 drug resistance transporter, EmrB/QacA subfamily [Streptoalloteichus tenebrarius]BFF02761.1 DHA2 family efflux MFS transporter permease subunit [Streptoalloteichus tenebrarius]
MTRTRNPWVVLGALCLGFFMIMLDGTIVNIAMPSMLTDLGSSLDEILWVVSVYVLTGAVPLILASRLGDRYGPKRLYLVGLAVFTVASAWCGLSGSVGMLVAARALQGLGAALLTPQTSVFVATLFPPNRRGAAFGLWSGVAGVATLSGPLVGGVLVTHLSWEWIFFVNVPVGVVGLVLAAVLVPDLRPGAAHSFDLPGLLLVTTGLFAVSFGLLEGERFHWGTVVGPLSIPLVLAAGVVLLLLFVVQQRRNKHEPLVPMTLFAHRNFGLANAVGLGVSFAMIGMMLPVTLYLQAVLGLSAVTAGLLSAPTSVVAGLVGPFAGRLADRVGGKYLLLFGLVAYGAGFGTVCVTAEPDSNPWTFLPALAVAGVGIGCVFTPMANVAMGSMDKRLAGSASGVFNTTRQVGSVLGSAAVGALLQARLVSALHDEATARSGQLPEALRRRFVEGVDQVAGGGVDLGGAAGPKLPSDVPPDVAQTLGRLGAEVFQHGFVAAMRHTILLPIGVLAIAALCCLAMVRRPRQDHPERGGAPQEPSHGPSATGAAPLSGAARPS